MKAFQKNVFRLAKQNKGSFLGAVLIIAIGIFIYVAMMDTLENLKGQINYYYKESALADVFAKVSGISEADLNALTQLPGIASADGKMTEDIRLLAEGQEEIVTVHLLSYVEEDFLNRLTLSSALTRTDELFLGARMTNTYGYKAGEPLRLLWKGNAVDFTLSGTCYEPDYIYSIPPGGAMIPDGEVYDIACIGIMAPPGGME